MSDNEKQNTGQISAEELERARSGDREAMTRIYEATSLEIYRTIHAMVRDEQTVLDIQQDVYVQAFSHLDQLREADSLLPWLRRIAVNRARSQLRKDRPLLFTELTAGDGTEPDFPDEHEGGAPEVQMEKKEAARLVREILDGLPDGQRLLIGMYYYEQMPVKKIAEDLGISEGTVKTQLFRGRRRVETEVRRLEEQGVKLYGLSPLPFLAALLRRLAPVEAAEKQVLAGALGKSGGAVVLQAGKPFFETVLGRVLIGAALAAAVGGAAAGGKWLNSHHMQKNTPDPETTENVLYLPTVDEEDPTEPPGPVVPTVPDLPDPTAPEQPTEPAPDEPAVTEPEVTQPYYIEPPATEPPVTQPPVTEPPVTEPPALEPAFLKWYWEDKGGNDSMDRSDLSPRTNHIYNSSLHVLVAGEIAPELDNDNPQAVSITLVGSPTTHQDMPELVEEGTYIYSFSVKYLREGTAHISCRLNGETVGSLTLSNQSYQPMIPEEGISFWGWEPIGDALPDAKVGDTVLLNVEARFTTLIYQPEYLYPEVSTDRPDLVQLRFLTQGTGKYSDGTSAAWDVVFKGCGTAHLTISLNGEVVKTYTVNITEPDT